MVDEFELERTYDRADLAAFVGELATALETGQPFRLHTAAEHLEVAFPDRLAAEIDAEHDPGDPGVTEFELELEWDDPDGSSIQIGDAEVEPSGSAVDESAPTDRSEAKRADATADDDHDEGESETQTRQRTSRFEVYQDRAEEWRWRLVHWNGNIIADSGEGYSSKSNAKRAVRGVMRAAPAATIDETNS